MGLACSQVRLLTLINRKADNELETMLISNKKLALSREQSNLSQEYYSKLQTKKLNYYNNGAYVPITYSYLMGDASYKEAALKNVCNVSGDTFDDYPATKTDNSIILTDYRGLVVLNEGYANAIQAVCGENVSWDGNGRGGTFSTSFIPEIIANYVGLAGEAYDNFMTVYNGGTVTAVIEGTRPNGQKADMETDRTNSYQALIDFYKPIFQACATNGWTTEYTSNLPDSDYISNALTSGIFQLATVDSVGRYEAGTSLQYYLNAAFVTERRDSVEQEEITAWYNAEKEKISAKEDYWDVQLTNLATELSAIETEIESVQSLIDDAVQSVFDWGG